MGKLQSTLTAVVPNFQFSLQYDCRILYKLFGFQLQSNLHNSNSYWLNRWNEVQVQQTCSGGQLPIVISKKPEMKLDTLCPQVTMKKYKLKHLSP
jgi:hypothetical protein